jgi:hypothetical protein
MYIVKVIESWGIGLGPVAKIEWHRRHSDAHYPFLVKRMTWSWFSAELVRIQPTELGYRVKEMLPIIWRCMILFGLMGRPQ